ncbi:MAG: cytidylate kinase-like family protein [Nitrospirae bacterium]|nr:cytidylate kinase-like family protein [Nitrospirota bacterium]MBF0541800.1 cytidylate kinase-like family protein [Nitrospirota bacterium]
MSIITLTTATYSNCGQMITTAAKELNYDILGNEVIDLAAKEFNVSKNKIEQALYKAPAYAGRVHPDKNKYITYLQTVLIRCFLKNNIIYYGPAGFLLVRGISHMFNVRIIANIKDRIQQMMEIEGISSNAAEISILKNDEEFSKWSDYIFKADISDPNFYDLVIDLDKMNEQGAIKLIVNAILSKRYKLNRFSYNCLKDLELSLTLKSRLLDIDPRVMVYVKGEKIFVDTICLKEDSERRINQIKSMTDEVFDHRGRDEDHISKSPKPVIERIRVIEDYFETILSKYS